MNQLLGRKRVRAQELSDELSEEGSIMSDDDTNGTVCVKKKVLRLAEVMEDVSSDEDEGGNPKQDAGRTGCIEHQPFNPSQVTPENSSAEEESEDDDLRRRRLRIGRRHRNRSHGEDERRCKPHGLQHDTFRTTAAGTGDSFVAGNRGGKRQLYKQHNR